MGEQFPHESLSESAPAMIRSNDDIEDERSEHSIRQHPRKGNEAIVSFITEADDQIRPLQ